MDGVRFCCINVAVCVLERTESLTHRRLGMAHVRIGIELPWDVLGQEDGLGLLHSERL